nr:uncharacterized protein LOC117992278 [Maniola hyperantus]
MLDKFRGIKPTRLWHLTSLKAFRAAIKDRYDAVKNLDARFYKPRHNLAFAGFVWISALAIFYTMGLFAPEKALKNLLPYECKTPPFDSLDLFKKEETKKSACPPVNKKGPC